MEVAPETLARLRAVCLELPEANEEPAPSSLPLRNIGHPFFARPGDREGAP